MSFFTILAIDLNCFFSFLPDHIDGNLNQGCQFFLFVFNFSGSIFVSMMLARDFFKTVF